MSDWIDIARGPLFAVSFLIMTLGLARLVLLQLHALIFDKGRRLKQVSWRQTALDSLGWAFFKLNDMENAEKYLLEADKMVRNDPIIDEHLGDLYFKTGNLQKAQDFWMKSVSIATEPEDIQKVRQKLEKLQQTLRKQKSEK